MELKDLNVDGAVNFIYYRLNHIILCIVFYDL